VEAVRRCGRSASPQRPLPTGSRPRSVRCGTAGRSLAPPKPLNSPHSGAGQLAQRVVQGGSVAPDHPLVGGKPEAAVPDALSRLHGAVSVPTGVVDAGTLAPGEQEAGGVGYGSVLQIGGKSRKAESLGVQHLDNITDTQIPPVGQSDVVLAGLGVVVLQER